MERRRHIVERRRHIGVAFTDWLAGVGMVFGTLFGIGKLVLGEPLAGCAFLALALRCGAVIARSFRLAAPATEGKAGHHPLKR